MEGSVPVQRVVMRGSGWRITRYGNGLRRLPGSLAIRLGGGWDRRPFCNWAAFWTGPCQRRHPYHAPRWQRRTRLWDAPLCLARGTTAAPSRQELRWAPGRIGLLTGVVVTATTPPSPITLTSPARHSHIARPHHLTSPQRHPNTPPASLRSHCSGCSLCRVASRGPHFASSR